MKKLAEILAQYDGSKPMEIRVYAACKSVQQVYIQLGSRPAKAEAKRIVNNLYDVVEMALHERGWDNK